MGELPRVGEAVAAELRRQVEVVNDLYLERWQRDDGQRRRLSRLVYGTNPRYRYRRAEGLVVLRNALTELIIFAHADAVVTDVQCWRIHQIGKEIDSWRPAGQRTSSLPETEHRGQKGVPAVGAKRFRPEAGKPGLEVLWQAVCDVECLTVEVADEDWLRRRLDRQVGSAVADHRKRVDAPGHDNADALADAQARQRDLGQVRNLLLDGVRWQARLARQRRGDEEVRAERLMTAGVLTFPAAVSTAAFFSWALYWPDASVPGKGYLLLRPVLALSAGALGGGLARLVRMRDTPVGTLEADRFRRAFVVQMMLGSAFGVVALVLVQLGALPKIGDGGIVELIALYAFLAGWSEPFIIGVLSRLGSSQGSPPRHGNDQHGTNSPGSTADISE